MTLDDRQILAAVGVNGASGSLTPLVSNLQPVLSVVLILVQIGVAVITILLLSRKLKNKE